MAGCQASWVSKLSVSTGSLSGLVGGAADPICLITCSLSMFLMNVMDAGVVMIP